jgi:hypothetical protein
MDYKKELGKKELRKAIKHLQSQLYIDEVRERAFLAGWACGSVWNRDFKQRRKTREADWLEYLDIALERGL